MGWNGGKAEAGKYIVKYWVIVKPGMSPNVIKDRAHAFVKAESTQQELFKAGLESSGLSMTSIAERAPPTIMESIVLKDPLGQNINPFSSAPGSNGLGSWQ